MKELIAEFSALLNKGMFLFGLKKSAGEKEQVCIDFVDIRRRETNLRRSMLLSFFFILMIIISFAVPIIRSQLVRHDLIVMCNFVLLLVAYIAVSQGLYVKCKKTEHYTEKHKLLVSAFYCGFWIFYYIVSLLSAVAFENPLERTIIWLIMMFVGLTIPIFTRFEVVAVYGFSIVSIIIFVSTIELEHIVIITCVPIVFFLYLIIQINHLERLEAFYEISKTVVESSENKRRLGNIFSKVYDMALEINLRTGEIETLKGNDFYGLYPSLKVDFDGFKTMVSKYIFEDDVQLFSGNFDLPYITEKIKSEGNQIYFEGRMLTDEEDYRWFSILLTKETSSSDDGYVLCLIQSINERKQNEDKLRLEAEKDPLTKLYNKITTRSLIEECLEQNPSSQHALIIIDIDNFKTINDTRGHAVGDQILLAFAAELNKNFRETDILGRAGGDEFVVLIKNVQSIAMICDKLQHLSSSFKKYGIDHGFPGRLSTSIGVAMFNKDGRTYEELFKKADAALYEAKRNGKDQYKFSISRT